MKALKSLFLIAVVALSICGCTDDYIIIVQVCTLPPEHCAMSPQEFTRFFDAKSEADQAEYVENYGKPKRSGFVAVPLPMSPVLPGPVALPRPVQ